MRRACSAALSRPQQSGVWFRKSLSDSNTENRGCISKCHSKTSKGRCTSGRATEHLSTACESTLCPIPLSNAPHDCVCCGARRAQDADGAAAAAARDLGAVEERLFALFSCVLLVFTNKLHEPASTRTHRHGPRKGQSTRRHVNLWFALKHRECTHGYQLLIGAHVPRCTMHTVTS